nr:unnamed protein product [Callosobruchus analis]
MFSLLRVLDNFLGANSVRWHYFESHHGKGAPDGRSGCVKRTTDSFVARGEDIPNYETLLKKLQTLNGILVLPIDEGEISEFDSKIPVSLEAFKGTMKIHEALWIKTNPFVVRFRRLSCSDCTADLVCMHYNLGKVYSPSESSCSSEDELPLSTFVRRPSILNPEDFVLVQIPGKKNHYYHYVAVTISVESENDYTVKYLLHFLSDGPSTQYENKKMFSLLRVLDNFLGANSVRWHYFESHHGKGAPDGRSGCVKRTTDSFVARGEDIPNYETLLKKLQTLNGILVLPIDEGEISEFDSKIPVSLEAFKGTMKIHEALWIKTNPFVVRFRRLSCSDCTADLVCMHYNLGKVYSPSESSCSSEDELPLSTFVRRPSILNPEDFVLVQIPGKKNHYYHYVAVTISVESENDYTVKYLLHFLSDGPSTQYENKKMFSLLRVLDNFLGANSVRWHYFESHHGKGAPDGRSGCVKRTTDSFVARGEDIPNYETLLKKLQTLNGILVLPIDEGEISEFDSKIPVSLEAFKGTMKIHEALWIKTNPFVVRFRRLSCSDCTADLVCMHYNLGKVYSPSESSCSSEDELPLSTFVRRPSILNPEDFVLVQIPGKKNHYYHYVAVTISVESENDYTVKYLRKSTEGLFTFSLMSRILVSFQIMIL